MSGTLNPVHVSCASCEGVQRLAVDVQWDGYSNGNTCRHAQDRLGARVSETRYSEYDRGRTTRVREDMVLLLLCERHVRTSQYQQKK